MGDRTVGGGGKRSNAVVIDGLVREVLSDLGEFAADRVLTSG